MKLLTCFKLCPDTDKLRPGDLKIGEEMSIPTYFLPNMINCYDESGLEFGIRLSEQSESLMLQSGTTAKDKVYDKVEKTAITIGGESTEPTLKSLMALGYEHVVRVKADENEICFAPSSVAKSITNYINEYPQDIIIAGREAPLGNNAATAQLISALTGYPLVSSVIDIEYLNDEELKVTVINNGSVYVQTVACPCIISMGNAVISRLRMPLLRDRMKCKNRTPEYFEFQSSDNPVFPQPKSAELPDRRRAGDISESGGSEAVDYIFASALSERLGYL